MNDTWYHGACASLNVGFLVARRDDPPANETRATSRPRFRTRAPARAPYALW